MQKLLPVAPESSGFSLPERQSFFGLKNHQSRIKDAYRGRCRVAMWPQHRLLYLRLPKCGNSSIMAALPNPEQKRLRQSVLSDSFQNWITFTFVRNPWSRLVSTYKQKVAEGATTSRLRGGVYEGFQERGIPVYSGMSFVEFCEMACSFTDDFTDKHLRSQSYSLIYKGTPVVREVGHLETIDEDWRRIAERAGITQEIPRLNASAGPHVHYREYYRDNRLVNLVGDRYASDIANFNYDFQ